MFILSSRLKYDVTHKRAETSYYSMRVKLDIVRYARDTHFGTGENVIVHLKLNPFVDNWIVSWLNNICGNTYLLEIISKRGIMFE